jgi:hypothetical protein
MTETQAPTIICEYCGAPIPKAQIFPMAYRLRYHAACKRKVDRARQAARIGDPLSLTCAHCAGGFIAKRKDAKYCSTRCRTAAHRA